MAGTHDWKGQAGDGWAQEWRRTDRSFGGLTERLLSRTRDFAFSSALDIGCGAGELSLAIGRGRPHARVIGVDISRSLIEVARKRGERLLNVDFELSDAAQWQPSSGFSPQLLVSRHGVMFFDDPVAAFTHFAEISAPDAGLLFSCFREPQENEIFSGVGALLPPPETPPDPRAPGPMAFADRDYVRSILSAAGWKDVGFEPYDFAMVVGMGEDPAGDAISYLLSIGTAAARLPDMPPAEQEAFHGRLRAFVESRVIDGLVALRAAAWIVTARRA